VGVPDLAFQALHGCGLASVVVLIVQRQVVDLQLLERQFRRRQFHDRIGQFKIP